MGQTPASPLDRPRQGVSRLWVRSALAPPLWSRAAARRLLVDRRIAAARHRDPARASRSPACCRHRARRRPRRGARRRDRRGLRLRRRGRAERALGRVERGVDGDARRRRGVERQRGARVAAAGGGDTTAPAARSPAPPRGARPAARGASSELAAALLDMLVPAYADAAMLDLGIQDLDRRVGARVAGPGAARPSAGCAGARPVDPSLPGTAAGHRHGTAGARRGGRRRAAARPRGRRRRSRAAARARRPLGPHAAARDAGRAVRGACRSSSALGAALRARRPRVRRARPGPHRDRARQHRAEPCGRAQRGRS